MGVANAVLACAILQASSALNVTAQSPMIRKEAQMAVSHGSVPNHSGRMKPFAQRRADICRQPGSWDDSVVGDSDDLRKLWLNYRAKHRQTRACLERGLGSCGGVLVWSCHETNVCGGLGDEIKGLTSSLVAAMASQRAFFVQWVRRGHRMLDLFQSAGIDVSPPAGLKQLRCWTQVLVDQEWQQFGHALEKFGSRPCVRLRSNIDPSSLWDEHQELLLPGLDALTIVPKFYGLGCLMSFMFKPLEMTPDMVVGLPVSDFIAVHARTPDEDMQGLAKLSKEDQRKITSSLRCAEQLGARLFGMEPFEVFLASSSMAVKQKAKLEASNLLIPLVVTNGTPVHIDWRGDIDTQHFLDGFWKEFVILQHAQGLVLGGRASGFSMVAASMSFLPEENILDESCQKQRDVSTEIV